ncbi:MAG: hypothetical protein HC913_08965 [Microscillaceae bacterium]|nr:hypothetical protein [Microscillaceae bacterium]
MKLGKNRYAEKFPQEARYYPHARSEKKLSSYGTPDSASKAYEATHLEALGGAGAWIASAPALLQFCIILTAGPNPVIFCPRNL